MSLVDQITGFAGSVEHALLDGDGAGRPPSEEELARPYVAPSGTPMLPRGVVFSADWKKFADGMARHSRAQAAALAAAGIPVSLQSISSEGIFLDGDIRPEVRAEAGHLAAVSVAKVSLGIRHAIFHTAEFVRNLVLPAGARLASFEHEKAVYDSTIVYTSLERDRVSPVLIDIFLRCAQLWVPCERNKRALVDSGMPSEKVHVVPFPYDPAGAVSRIPAPRGSERVPGGKRFYSIGKWEPRKNHAGLLHAFLLAYTPKDKASLLLKVHGWGAWDDYPSIPQALELAGADERVRANGWTDEKLRKRVRIIADKVSDAEIVELHAKNNIYVSASRGEAWDIPAFEARCAGNRLVHVGFGGSEDYAGEGDVAVEHTLCPVDPAYGWEGSNWADYELDALVCALRAAEPPKRRIHPVCFNNRYSIHAVGELMKEKVLSLDPSLADAGSYG